MRSDRRRFVLLFLMAGTVAAVLCVAVASYFSRHQSVSRQERLETLAIREEKRTGPVQPFGKDEVFFTAYCGSGCEGLNVVNLTTGEIKRAMLSYIAYEPKRGEYTIFQDWTGTKYEFDGVPSDITSQTDSEHTSLIFHMIDEKGDALGIQRVDYPSR